MIKEDSYEKARKEIEKLAKEGKEVVVQGGSIDFNRLILDNKKVGMLVLSHDEGKDRLKQRDSGLNEVLCGIAKKNNISFAFDVREVRNFSEHPEVQKTKQGLLGLNELKIEDRKQRGKMLGRMMQNIYLIKKGKNKLRLLNFNTKEGGFSFLISLGADSSLAREAVS